MLLLWVALAITQQRAGQGQRAGVGARQRLSKELLEIAAQLRGGAKHLAHRRSMYAEEAYDATQLYQETVSSMGQAFEKLGTDAVSLHDTIQQSLNEITGKEADQAALEQQIEEQASTHEEAFNIMLTDVEKLENQINTSYAGELEHYQALTEELLERVADAITDASGARDEAITRFGFTTEDTLHAALSEVQEATAEMNHELKMGRDDFEDLADESEDDIDDFIDEYKDLSKKIERSNKKGTVKILTRQKGLDRKLNKAQKDFDKDKQRLDKDITKYEKKQDKFVKSTAEKAVKQMEKTEKKIKKVQQKAMKSDAKDLGKVEKVAFKDIKKTVKYAEKEGKIFAKSALKAQKVETKDTKKFEKEAGDVTKDTESLVEDVADANSFIRLLDRNFIEEHGAAHKDLTNELNAELKESSTETQAEILKLQKEMKLEAKDAAIEVQDANMDLHDKVIEPTKERLDEARRQAMVSMLASIEEATGTTEKAQTTAKVGHSAAEVNQEAYDDVMGEFNTAITLAKGNKEQTEAMLNRILGLQKVSFLSKGRNFQTEASQSVKTMPSDFVEWNNKIAEAVRDYAGTVDKELMHDTTDGKKIQKLLKQQALGLKQHTDVEMKTILALQSKDFADLNRQFQTSDRVLAGDLAHTNASFTNDLLGKTTDDLDQAHRELKFFFDGLLDKTEKETKNSAAMSEEQAGANMRRIMNLLSQMDTESGLKSSSLLGAADQTEATVGTIDKDVKQNDFDFDRTTKASNAGQAKLGASAMSTLQMAINSALSTAEGADRNAILALANTFKQDERALIGDTVHKFSDDLSAAQLQHVKKVEHMQENMRALGLTANKKSHELNGEVDVSDEEANQISKYLADSQNRMRATAGEIERSATSLLKQSQRQQGGILKDAQDAMSREAEEVGKDLKGVKQQIDKKVQGISAETASHNVDLSQLADQELSQALTAVGREPDMLEQTENQANMLERTLESGFEDGMERFDKRNDALKLRSEDFERTIANQNKATLLTEQLENKGRLSEERVTAGTKVLGEKTGSVSEDAATDVAVAGSKAESDIKGASMQTDLHLQNMEASEQAFYAKQEAKDSDLASQVGLELRNVQQVQYDAMSKGKDMDTEKLDIQQLLENERRSLEKNLAYLQNFSIASGEKVKGVLNHVTQVIQTRLASADEHMAQIAQRQAAIESQADAILSSQAMQQLQRLSSADDYAAQVAREDDFLAMWMKDHTHAAEGFRAQVEKAFAKHAEASEVQRAVLQASDEEAKERAAWIEQAMAAKMQQQALQASVGSTEGVEKGMEAAIAAFKGREKANEALDSARIDTIAQAQSRLHKHGQKMLGDGQRALDALRETDGKSHNELNDMEKLLRSLGATHDAEVDAKMKELEDRQRNFDKQLMFAAMPADPPGSVRPPPTEKDLQYLLQEAKALSVAHEDLQAKHAAAGEQIGALLQKLTGALEKVQQESKDKPAALVEKKKTSSEAHMRTQR